MKKRFCVILSFLLVFTLLTPMFSLSASAANRIPVINVEGEKGIDVWNEDGTRYNPTESAADAIVENAIRELAPLFAKAFLTNNYTEWSQKALEMLTPIYDEIRPAPDGSLPPHTGPYLLDIMPASLDDLPAPESVNYYYSFGWDYRKSPLDAADDLDAYIQAVKAKANADKVVLVSRCGSTSLGAAYLYKYGTRDLAKLIFASSTLWSAPHADAIFSGNIDIPGKSFYYFMKAQDRLGSVDQRIVQFVNAMVLALNLNGSADDTIRVVMQVYDKIKDSFIAPFVRSYYCVCGGYISTIFEHYDDFRDYVFPTDELKAEYAPILEKADEYHNNVQTKLGELFAAAREDGVPTYIIAFYGEPNGYPVSSRSVLVGDELADAGLQSLGATVAEYPGTLSDEYIAGREQAGFGRFISPDRQIDASTCLLPETTFFIKNMRHQFFAGDLHNFFRLIAWTDDMTVNTLPDYPQFLTVVGNHAGLAPAQAVNENDLDPDVNAPDMSGSAGFFAKVLAFFTKIFVFFKKVADSIRSFGRGLLHV